LLEERAGHFRNALARRSFDLLAVQERKEVLDRVFVQECESNAASDTGRREGYGAPYRGEQTVDRKGRVVEDVEIQWLEYGSGVRVERLRRKHVGDEVEAEVPDVYDW
jgi:hypothetical protein